MVVFPTPALAAMDSMLTSRNPTSSTRSKAVFKIALWSRSFLGRPGRTSGITSGLFPTFQGQLLETVNHLNPKRDEADLIMREIRCVSYLLGYGPPAQLVVFTGGTAMKPPVVLITGALTG